MLLKKEAFGLLFSRVFSKAPFKGIEEFS